MNSNEVMNNENNLFLVISDPKVMKMIKLCADVHEQHLQ